MQAWDVACVAAFQSLSELRQVKSQALCPSRQVDIKSKLEQSCCPLNLLLTGVLMFWSMLANSDWCDLRRAMIKGAVLLLFAPLCLAEPVAPLNNNTVLAHMVNTTAAVDWAIQKGANGVEMDIRFSKDGTPLKFRHSYTSEQCDCSHDASSDDHVCKHLISTDGNLCHAETDATTMLTHLGTSNLAVVYIDSKVDTEDAPDLSLAGQKVVKFLDDHLFAKGYKGQVIVSTPSVNQILYTKSAVSAAGSSPNKTRYFFTIDGPGPISEYIKQAQGNQATHMAEFFTRMKFLMTLTKNRVYSTGISSILGHTSVVGIGLPLLTFYDEVALSAYNQKAGVVGSTGIWTVDDPATINKYLAGGANAIMSNKPGVAVGVVLGDKRTLAKPGDALHAATSDAVVTRYQAGGPCELDANCESTHCKGNEYGLKTGVCKP
jgi:glycerophosphoryl diester phosphodiesterase